MDLVALFVPLAGILGPVLVICMFFYFRFRARAELQATVRQAIDKGHELTPELLERLGETRRTPETDLRRGVVSIMAALAVGAFAFLVGEDDALGPLLGIAAFPLFIGVAYLGLWRARRDKQ